MNRLHSVICVLAFVYTSSALSATLSVPSAQYPTIQSAIDDAVDGDTVEVAAGSYYENLTWELKSIKLIGAGAGLTIVDADVDLDGVPGPGRCLYMSNVPDTAIIEGFTFTGGAADRGGGLSLYSCSLLLTKNTITGNSVSLYGGGLFLHDSPVTLTNNSITDNETTVYSQYYGGGGIFVAHSSPTITNNIIADNSTERHGGGLSLSGGSTAIVTCNSITGNYARVRGGGVYIRGSSPSFTNNTVADNSGGGIMWLGETSGTFTGNTISNNSEGGAYISPPITVTMNTFTGNTHGGLQSGSALVINNTFTGNYGQAISVGGSPTTWTFPVITNNLIIGNNGDAGVYVHHYCSVKIINNTFVSNNGGLGGAIYLLRGREHTIVNNIMMDNTPYRGGAVFANAEPGMIETTYINYNVLWNNTYGQIGGGAEDIVAEPMFIDPAAGDYHLQADSPCIDAGDNSAVPQGIVTDYDGNPRIVNGTVDMGAFEAPPMTPETMLAGTALFIMGEVDAGNIDTELEMSLLAKVDAALAALDRGNPNDAKVAMNDLKALINQVEAQVDKKITLEVATEIVECANEIITALSG